MKLYGVAVGIVPKKNDSHTLRVVCSGVAITNGMRNSIDILQDDALTFSSEVKETNTKDVMECFARIVGAVNKASALQERSWESYSKQHGPGSRPPPVALIIGQDNAMPIDRERICRQLFGKPWHASHEAYYGNKPSDEPYPAYVPADAAKEENELWQDYLDYGAVAGKKMLIDRVNSFRNVVFAFIGEEFNIQKLPHSPMKDSPIDKDGMLHLSAELRAEVTHCVTERMTGIRPQDLFADVNAMNAKELLSTWRTLLPFVDRKQYTEATRNAQSHRETHAALYENIHSDYRQRGELSDRGFPSAFIAACNELPELLKEKCILKWGRFEAKKFFTTYQAWPQTDIDRRLIALKPRLHEPRVMEELIMIAQERGRKRGEDAISEPNGFMIPALPGYIANQEVEVREGIVARPQDYFPSQGAFYTWDTRIRDGFTRGFDAGRGKGSTFRHMKLPCDKPMPFFTDPCADMICTLFEHLKKTRSDKDIELMDHPDSRGFISECAKSVTAGSPWQAKQGLPKDVARIQEEGRSLTER